ncbi:MAG: hypothetical protein FJW20_24255 [Acidimicrobiia bacterium]|nr:hypothetical protein [Acidimicrobiia bacterium]
MFDLFRSRAKATRYLLMALLSLVALSMVITLIPGFGGGFGSSNQLVLAEIGDNVISSQDINRLVQAQMRQNQFPRDMAELIVPQMVTQFVGEMATVYQAERMGFTVSEEELIEGIRKVIPQLFQSGQFVGKEAYQAYLQQMNTTIPQFEENVRKQILLNKLQSLVFDGLVITPEEIKAEYLRRGEKVKLEVVRFQAEELKSQVVISRKEIEDHYKTNAAAYMSAPRRTIDVILVDEKKLGEKIPVTEELIRQSYESNKDRYRIDERAKVRHILVKAEPDDEAEKKKAKAKAEGLLKQIRGGADFAELAKKNSDDPGSAVKGGDLDWIQRGQTVPPFEKTSFEQKPGQISEPVETFFGYHIIHTLDKEPARIKPLDEVREELTAELKRRQLFEKMPELADQARAELLKTPLQAQQVAAKLNLTHIRADKIAPGDAIPGVGSAPELINIAFSIDKGTVTEVMQLPENRLAVSAVVDIMPPRQSSLSEVEATIRTQLSTVKTAELVETKAKEFETRLRANQNDLRKTAQELGAKIITTNEFDRTGQMEGIGPAAYLGEQPFVRSVGTVVALYRVSTTPYFFKILSRSPPDLNQLEAQRDIIVTGLRDKKLRERRELFEDGLVRKLTEEGKIKINDDAVKRLAASYKG